MKITRLTTYHLRPRWLLLKIETDAGIHGLGEPLLEGRALTVETAVQEIGRTLVGEDPTRIEHLWQRYYRGTFYRGGPVLMSALSGIEQALWDIKGKAANLPVYELLGGRVRDRIRLYGWLQLDACTPNFLCQEQLTLGETLLTEPIRVEDVYALLPDAPVLGVEIDPVKLEAERFEGVWETPQFRRKDGAIAEW